MNSHYRVTCCFSVIIVIVPTVIAIIMAVVVAKGVAVGLLVRDRLSDGYCVLLRHRDGNHMRHPDINHVLDLHGHINRLLHERVAVVPVPPDHVLLDHGFKDYLLLVPIDGFLLVPEPRFVDCAGARPVLVFLMDVTVFVLVRRGCYYNVAGSRLHNVGVD